MSEWKPGTSIFRFPLSLETRLCCLASQENMGEEGDTMMEAYEYIYEANATVVSLNQTIAQLRSALIRIANDEGFDNTFEKQYSVRIAEEALKESYE